MVICGSGNEGGGDGALQWLMVGCVVGGYGDSNSVSYGGGCGYCCAMAVFVGNDIVQQMKNIRLRDINMTYAHADFVEEALQNTYRISYWHIQIQLFFLFLNVHMQL